MAQVFFCEFCKIPKITFLHRTPLVATSDYKLRYYKLSGDIEVHLYHEAINAYTQIANTY